MSPADTRRIALMNDCGPDRGAGNALRDSGSRQALDEAAYREMVRKGTRAWAVVPCDWLEELRGGGNSGLDAATDSDT